MKHIIILGDGMADYPIKEFGNKTPLMAANTPHIDKLCKKGRCGKLITVPKDMPPGSEIANMAVLGYDVKKVYQGRGVLEAASMGIELDDNDMAMRCNLICIKDENNKDNKSEMMPEGMDQDSEVDPKKDPDTEEGQEEEEKEQDFIRDDNQLRAAINLMSGIKIYESMQTTN